MRKIHLLFLWDVKSLEGVVLDIGDFHAGRLIFFLFRLSAAAAAERGAGFFFFDPAFAGSGARSASPSVDSCLKQ